MHMQVTPRRHVVGSFFFVMVCMFVRVERSLRNPRDKLYRGRNSSSSIALKDSEGRVFGPSAHVETPEDARKGDIFCHLTPAVLCEAGRGMFLVNHHDGIKDP